MRKTITSIACACLLASVSAWSGDTIPKRHTPERSAADSARDAADYPQEVLAFSGVHEGMHIGDIFAGAGYYSELLAQAVGKSGQVLLHNNAAYLSYVDKALEQRLAGGHLSNVLRLDSEAEALGLKPASLDGVFLVLAFHDFYFKDKNWAVDATQVMPQLLTALKPGGFLLIIDHRAQVGSGSASAQDLHRIDEKFAHDALEGFGFAFVKDSPLLHSQHDDHMRSAFDPTLRGHTDRFMHLYRKPD